MTDRRTIVTTSQVMTLSPVIPVLTIERLSDAVPLARALTEGGLYAIEVTLRTACALEAITAIGAEVPKAVVGAGTVLNGRQFDQAVAAGARFIVSPGLTQNLVEAAQGGPPLLPGVTNPSDLMRGLEAGLTHFKFFPAEASGGPAVLKALAGPFGQVRFCPTGGITLAKAPGYLSLPNVLCIGGAWVCPDEAIAAGDWARITGLAREAAALK